MQKRVGEREQARAMAAEGVRECMHTFLVFLKEPFFALAVFVNYQKDVWR
jgi:hypothetical protein